MKTPFKKKPKEYSLSQEEISEASILAQCLFQYDQIVKMWEQKQENFQQRVLARIGLLNEQDKYFVNWETMFSTGKIFLVQKPEPTVASNPSTPHEQELPKEQKS